MPIVSERWGGSKWPMHSEELRETLGIPKRLPDGPMGPFQIQGYTVVVLSRPTAKALSTAGKPHRIRAECKGCGCLIPFGRLRQHERACKQLTDNTTI